MKKLIGLALATALITSVSTGCTQNPTETINTSLADGVYSSIGSADSSGWIPEISITIASGAVTAVKYDEVAALKKSESIEYQKSFKAAQKIDLPAVYSTMQNSLIKSQNITKIDAVAGATKSAESFKTLTADALKNAIVEGKYIDGEYTATGVKDEKNWTPSIMITIKDGKITSVKYDEVSSNIFKNKSKDNAYISKYKEKMNLDILTIYDLLQKSLIETQDPTKIDAIAGATATYNNFKALASDALNKAK